MEDQSVHSLDAAITNLAISEEEEGLSFALEGGLQIPVDDFRTWTVVGRFLTNKPIKFDIMQQVLASVWRPAMGVRFRQGEGGLFWFYFYHEKDAKRIIEEGPWSFENNMLLCRLVEPGETIKAADLYLLELWVQVHDLPPGYTSPTVLEARRMKLTKRDGSIVWVLFKYERITVFCYYCGILGHLSKHCRMALLSSLEPENYPYDESLKAGGRKPLLTIGEPWIRHVEPIEVRRLVDARSDGEGSKQDEDLAFALVTKRKRGPPGAMSLISWNCRGLGNRRTVQEVAELASVKKPEFIFLMETKCARSKAEELRLKLGFEGLFYVDSVGLSGGLALLWKEKNSANLISYSRFHVDIAVSLRNLPVWRLTGFYGNPRRDGRQASWDLLQSLKHKSQLPWVVVGDFNDLCATREKKGGNPHPHALISGFNTILSDCGLFDLGMRGYPFTWERGRGSPNWIEERLDRAVASGSWKELFDRACVFNQHMHRSDHSTLFLSLAGPTLHSRERRFRFENAWLKDEGFKEVLISAWGESSEKPFSERLDFCGRRFLQWGGDKFQKFGKRTKELRDLIQKVRGRRDEEGRRLLSKADAELSTLLDQEDVYWRQRAKQH
ncbi:unnamed protein product [Cuscuta campestris]|uniref:CCHC-type domain-containing protein n=1 Tax=Cuscuta campestris TaxID=132261 RepID=A0A484M6Q7_9ASTE|nr:unnamed protein product [Cuscuta campestris]